ncbi:hypothetical protein B0J13DRAFT_677006 [Dactylonectria estremocensis]|uniref:Uncharacterized protein n=1 Tax=Dactylonectria estremocensis TaxID=1079267 RepID=A0A9P9EML9_9HYPO|nr:hypothetical protein B0J13DRAFT_677006 [Dactylonectria estremocensis]
MAIQASPCLFTGPDDSTLGPARHLLQLHAGNQLTQVGLLPHQVVITYEDLNEKIEALKLSQDEDCGDDTVKSGILNAFHGRQRWRTNRQKPTRVPGAWVQKMACTFGDFLSSYSGIVEVVKGVDSQYGGLAYGMLSALLSVAVNKGQHEQEIEDALDEFSMAFPRLQNLRDIHPERSETLKRLVAKIYGEIILFTHDCIKYYNATSSGRLKHTTLHPPKVGIQPKVATIRRLLAETRWESEVLMQRQIANLAQHTEELKKHSQDLEKKLSELYELETRKQQDSDERSVTNFRTMLGIQEEDLHCDHKRYKSLLDEAFADFLLEQDRPYIMTLEMLQAEEPVQRWMKSRESGILNLAGQNWSLVNNTTLCWLSYVAVLLSKPCASGNEVVATYFCQATATIWSAKRPCIKNVVMSWLYQIAKSNPQLLRPGFENIARLLTSQMWTEDAEGALDATRDIFHDFISGLDRSTRVTLIFDRVDQCCLSEKSDPSRFDLDTVLDWLISLAGKAPCTLKILLITHCQPQQRGKMVKKRKHIAAIESGLLIQKLDWDQGADQ